MLSLRWNWSRCSRHTFSSELVYWHSWQLFCKNQLINHELTAVIKQKINRYVQVSPARPSVWWGRYRELAWLPARAGRWPLWPGGSCPPCPLDPVGHRVVERVLPRGAPTAFDGETRCSTPRTGRGRHWNGRTRALWLSLAFYSSIPEKIKIICK